MERDVMEIIRDITEVLVIHQEAMETHGKVLKQLLAIMAEAPLPPKKE